MRATAASANKVSGECCHGADVVAVELKYRQSIVYPARREGERGSLSHAQDKLCADVFAPAK